MAEPFIDPASGHSAADTDKAIQQALEKVRREAAQRLPARAPANASASRRKKADTQEQASNPNRRQGTERRTRQRSSSTGRRKTPSTKQHPELKARPVLLYGLALTVIAALGTLLIQAIHASTPPIAGFTPASTSQPNVSATAETTPYQSADLPITAALMRTQGWVLPSNIQIVDPALAKQLRLEAPGLAPEVAIIQALEVNVDPVAELAALTAIANEEPVDEPLPLAPPPPPMFGAVGGFLPDSGATLTGEAERGRGFRTGPRLALPPMRPFGNQLADAQAPFEVAPDTALGAFGETSTTDTEPGADSALTPLPSAPSMLDEINQVAPTLQPAPAPVQQAQSPALSRPQDPAVQPTLTLSQLQQNSCSRLGFFSRISCQDEIRQDYCKQRWNRHPDCSRQDAADTF